MSIYFADKKWPELKELIKKNALIILPVGQVEEHGKHLPIKTDTYIVEEVAKRIGESLKNEISLLIMPAVWSGYSMKSVAKWPGTMRLKQKTFINMVFDICSSVIEMGFKKIMIISGHGNHTGALRVVTRNISDKYNIYMALTYPSVMAKEEFLKISKAGPKGSCHGGEYETSLMLYLNKNMVDMKKATSQDKIIISSKFYFDKVFWSTWGLQKSKTGIYGDPTKATKETGKKIMQAIINNYQKFIKEFYENGK